MESISSEVSMQVIDNMLVYIMEIQTNIEGDI